MDSYLCIGNAIRKMVIRLQQEFLGHWNVFGTRYSYDIYDNGTNQSSTMNVLENYIKCIFRELDYIISVHFIRYMYDICLVHNLPTFIWIFNKL